MALSIFLSTTLVSFHTPYEQPHNILSSINTTLDTAKMHTRNHSTSTPKAQGQVSRGGGGMLTRGSPIDIFILR